MGIYVQNAMLEYFLHYDSTGYTSWFICLIMFLHFRNYFVKLNFFQINVENIYMVPKSNEEIKVYLKTFNFLLFPFHIIPSLF
jgi:hypothetical protein